jgi:hypothetical protein
MVRADLLPHQDFRAVFSAAPRPSPGLPQPASSRLPMPSWPRVASDIPAAAPAVTLAATQRAPPPVNLFSTRGASDACQRKRPVQGGYLAQPPLRAVMSRNRGRGKFSRHHWLSVSCVSSGCGSVRPVMHNPLPVIALV